MAALPLSGCVVLQVNVASGSGLLTLNSTLSCTPTVASISVVSASSVSDSVPSVPPPSSSPPLPEESFPAKSLKGRTSQPATTMKQSIMTTIAARQALMCCFAILSNPDQGKKHDTL